MEGDCGFLDAVVTSDACELYHFKIIRIITVYQLSEDSFRYTAGNAEYGAAARGQAERHIHGIRFYLGKVNAGFFYHPCDLSGGEHIINILLAIRVVFRSEDLGLFSCTWHDRYDNGLFLFGRSVHAGFFFEHSSEHLLR